MALPADILDRLDGLPPRRFRRRSNVSMTSLSTTTTLFPSYDDEDKDKENIDPCPHRLPPARNNGTGNLPPTVTITRPGRRRHAAGTRVLQPVRINGDVVERSAPRQRGLPLRRDTRFFERRALTLPRSSVSSSEESGDGDVDDMVQRYFSQMADEVRQMTVVERE